MDLIEPLVELGREGLFHGLMNRRNEVEKFLVDPACAVLGVLDSSKRNHGSVGEETRKRDKKI
jgi:hypothetical protein